jgi:hypothetical protein
MENVMKLLHDAEVTSLEGKFPDVLIFKTDIQDQHDVEKVAALMQDDPRIKRWNIDLQDIDKVLRIESKHVHEQEIIAGIRKAGYRCEELID